MDLPFALCVVMRNINLYVVLQLVGMLIEIVGAFILAADAIGLNRLRKWVKSLTHITAQLSQKEASNDSILKPSAARLVYTGIIAAGSGFGSWLSTHPPTWASYIPNWLFRAFSIVAGGLCGMLIFFVVVYSILALIGFINMVEVRARKRRAGLIGFLLLLVGFVSQFIGALGQALLKASAN